MEKCCHSICSIAWQDRLLMSRKELVQVPDPAAGEEFLLPQEVSIESGNTEFFKDCRFWKARSANYNNRNPSLRTFGNC
jgi:hypothetical protein